MTENTMLDLENMMDETLDSIPDAPDFANPPAGDYRIALTDSKIEKKANKEGVVKQTIRNMYSVVTTYSTAANEQPVPDGSLFSENFQGTEQGVSYFKKRMKGILNVSDLNGVSLGDIMNSGKGVEFDCRISIKKSPNPNDADNPYENIQMRIIPSKD